MARNKPITRKYKTIDFSKLYGRDKVVNNQFLLEYQTLENLKEFVSKRGNFEQVGETYEEVVSQAFKVARGIRYKDERKFVNPNYRGKGDQQKVALSNELKISQAREIKVSVANLKKHVKQIYDEDKERTDMIKMAVGNKASLIGEIAHKNMIEGKELMDFAKEAIEAAGISNSTFDKTYQSYADIGNIKRDKSTDNAALRRFNRLGHTWGLVERTRIVQENLVREILKGNRVMGIEGDPELASEIAKLEPREIYTLTLNKDFNVMFITSDTDIVEETSIRKTEKDTRKKMLEAIKKYIDLKKKGQATAKDFANILRIEPDEYIF
jgi:hypothetical protein